MKTKNIPLIIGICLPLLFILIISIVIFTPNLSIKPQHDFLYTAEPGYAYGQSYKKSYVVENNQITVKDLQLQPNRVYKDELPVLYLYDIKTNTSRQISLEEARKYKVDVGPSSPDGYTVRYVYNNSGIFELFGSNGNERGYYIEKGNGKKRLTGIANESRYSYEGNFQLIAWVK